MPEFEPTAAAIASLVVFVAAVLIAIALLVYVARHARQRPGIGTETGAEEPQPPRTLAPGESATLAELLEGGRDPEPFVNRFVDDAATGARAGESIAVDAGRLILKGEAGFVAVPLDKVVLKDDTLSVTEDVNWENAAREGAEWQNAHERPVEYDEEGNPVR